MGVRPPANDSEEPEPVEFGIVAVDARLDEMNVSFPATGEELTNNYGDVSIPVDPDGHDLTLATAVNRCEQDRFDSEQELLNALHPVFEEERESISNSLLGRLRSLSPF
jgi:hypothetical protein